MNRQYDMSSQAGKGINGKLADNQGEFIPGITTIDQNPSQFPQLTTRYLTINIIRPLNPHSHILVSSFTSNSLYNSQGEQVLYEDDFLRLSEGKT